MPCFNPADANPNLQTLDANERIFSQGISSFMPPRDIIPTANTIFSGVLVSTVLTLNSHHTLYFREFKMEAVKPDMLSSHLRTHEELKLK